MLFLLATGGQQSKADQMDRALPPPTGKNGYEEYIRAAKELVVGDFWAYELWAPGRPPEPEADPAQKELITRLNGMTYLAVKREEVERYGSALELVRAGSRKPVYDPRTQLTPETTFPELANFKALSRLFAAESYVKFANGDTAGGTRSFMDGLIFNYHIAGGSIIGSLVGVAGSAILFRPFASRLSCLSLQDCRDIQTIAASILSAPPRVAAGMEVERKASTAAVGRAITQPVVLAGAVDEESAKTVAELTKLTKGADLPSLVQEAAGAVNEYYVSLEAKLKLPESRWFGNEADMELAKKQHSAAVAMVIDLVMPSFDQVLAATAKQRTQFRLLALHGKILEYKWENNHLPGRLAEAVDEVGRHDPLSNREFMYVRREDGYRIYSLGAPNTGEIELDYHTPAATSSSAPVPP